MTATTLTAFDPKGKTFTQRVAAFQADVLATYALAIRKDEGRTPAWQQKHHIAHMFLYNAYTSTTPGKVDKGERTISWNHFQDASVIWSGAVSWSDFLRTKTNGIPTRDGKGWKQGSEPDKEKTRERAKQILVSSGIGNSGQAMVSSGSKPCGEPCRCGAGRSKHLDDSAVDFHSGDLDTLTSKLAAAKAGDVDVLLKRFGLHRPLAKHPKSPEKWHVEATD